MYLSTDVSDYNTVPVFSSTQKMEATRCSETSDTNITRWSSFWDITQRDVFVDRRFGLQHRPSILNSENGSDKVFRNVGHKYNTPEFFLGYYPASYICWPAFRIQNHY
jgi:hypothetical protein